MALMRSAENNENFITFFSAGNLRHEMFNFKIHYRYE